MTKRQSKNKDQLQTARQSQKPTHNQVQIAEQYQGPIPPPKFLSAYEEICPGLADRIIIMAEKEQTHRQDMEDKDLNASVEMARKEYSEARLGQVFALIIGLAVVGAGTYCATHGAGWPGAVIGSSGVLGLVSAFIIGRKIKSEERGKTKTVSDESQKAGKDS